MMPPKAKPPKDTAPTPLLETNGFTTEQVLDATLISLAAYDREGSGPTDLVGWQPLDLILPDGVPGSYDPSTGLYTNGNASCVVLIGDDGTIAIGFTGTNVDDPIGDMVEYWTFDADRMRSQYFGDLKGLVTAVLDQAAETGATDVLLTGHSLGGAAITGVYDWLPSTGGAYDGLSIKGITFNSPVTGYHPDAPLLEIAYVNDFIGGLLGQDAPNVLENIWYAVNPEAVAPVYDGADDLAYLSKLLQAYTSPAHDIERFTDALTDLAASDLHDMIGANDFLIIDNADYPVSVEGIVASALEAEAAYDAADRVAILGSRDGDILVGSAKTDIIDGGGGDDVVMGNAGDDWLYGGSGNDALFGGAGGDTLRGGEGDDVMEGGGGKDTFLIAGQFGNDVLVDWKNGETLAFTDYGVEFKNENQLKAWVNSTEAISVISQANDPLTIAVDDNTVTFQNIDTWDGGVA